MLAYSQNKFIHQNYHYLLLIKHLIGLAFLILCIHSLVTTSIKTIIFQFKYLINTMLLPNTPHISMKKILNITELWPYELVEGHSRWSFWEICSHLDSLFHGLEKLAKNSTNLPKQMMKFSYKLFEVLINIDGLKTTTEN